MSSNKILVSGTLVALLLIAVLVLPSTARAEDPARDKSADQAGMVVARDPVTGQNRMATPAEVRALRNQAGPRTMAAPNATSSAPVRRDNGTLHKHLGESNMVYSVVRRNADGKLETECVDGAPAAEAALQRPAASPAAKQPEQAHEHN
jgi:hypothetical protein